MITSFVKFVHNARMNQLFEWYVFIGMYAKTLPFASMNGLYVCTYMDAVSIRMQMYHCI